jgi:hypothetical protein
VKENEICIFLGLLAWLMFLETYDSLKPLESSRQCYNFIGNLLLTIEVFRETNNKLYIYCLASSLTKTKKRF